MRRDYEMEARVLQYLFLLGLVGIGYYIFSRAMQKLDLEFFDGFSVVVWILTIGYGISTYLVNNPPRKRNRK